MRTTILVFLFMGVAVVTSAVVMSGCKSSDDDSGTDSNTDSDADSDSDTDSDSDSDTDSDSNADTETETFEVTNCQDGETFSEGDINLKDIGREFPFDIGAFETIECPEDLNEKSSPCRFYDIGSSYYVGCCQGDKVRIIGVVGENRIKVEQCRLACNQLGEVIVNGESHRSHSCQF